MVLTEEEVKARYEFEQAKLRKLWEEQEDKRQKSIKENQEADEAEKNASKEK